jgi:hypothetical protein
MSEPEQVVIRNSEPNILHNEAYGPDGRRTQDVMVVNTAAGTSTHLSFNSVRVTTLCGQKVSHVARAWFMLSGCKKCAKTALKQGVAQITDTDGTLLDLSANGTTGISDHVI